MVTPIMVARTTADDVVEKMKKGIKARPNLQRFFVDRAVLDVRVKSDAVVSAVPNA